jgi:hypothetical protein
VHLEQSVSSDPKPLARLVTREGLRYYVNPHGKLIAIHLCTCGVIYDARCPVVIHQENAREEKREGTTAAIVAHTRLLERHRRLRRKWGTRQG